MKMRTFCVCIFLIFATEIQSNVNDGHQIDESCRATSADCDQMELVAKKHAKLIQI